MKGFERYAIRLLLSMSLEQAREALGFPPGYVPGSAEIQKAYKRKAIENHPDRGGSHEKMVEVNVAKEILEGKRHDRYSPPAKPAKSPEEIRKEEETRKRNVALRWIDESAQEVAQAIDSGLSALDIFKGKLHVRDFFLEEFADVLDKMQDDIEAIGTVRPAAKAKAQALIEGLAAKSLRLGKKYLTLQKLHGELAAGLLGLGGATGVTYKAMVGLESETRKYLTAFNVMFQESRALMTLIRTSEDVPMEWDDLYHRPHSVMDSFASDYKGYESNLSRASHRVSEALSHASQKISAALLDLDPDLLKKLPSSIVNWAYPDDFELAKNLVNGKKTKTADAPIAARVVARFKLARLNLDDPNNVIELLIDSTEAMGGEMQTDRILEPLEKKMLEESWETDSYVRKVILELYHATGSLFSANDELLSNTQIDRPDNERAKAEAQDRRTMAEAKRLEAEIKSKVKDLYRTINPAG